MAYGDQYPGRIEIVNFIVDAAAPEQSTTVTTETELSDYKQVQGRTMPFQMRQLVNGSPVAVITIQKIEFDVPVDAAFFKMQGR